MRKLKAPILIAYLFEYSVEFVKMFKFLVKCIAICYFFLILEEDQLKEQAKDFEKMKNMMEVFSSEHIKGNNSIFFCILEKRTFNLY